MPKIEYRDDTTTIERLKQLAPALDAASPSLAARQLTHLTLQLLGWRLPRWDEPRWALARNAIQDPQLARADSDADALLRLTRWPIDLWDAVYLLGVHKPLTPKQAREFARQCLDLDLASRLAVALVASLAHRPEWQGRRISEIADALIAGTPAPEGRTTDT